MTLGEELQYHYNDTTKESLENFPWLDPRRKRKEDNALQEKEDSSPAVRPGINVKLRKFPREKSEVENEPPAKPPASLPPSTQSTEEVQQENPLLAEIQDLSIDDNSGKFRI